MRMWIYGVYCWSGVYIRKYEQQMEDFPFFSTFWLLRTTPLGVLWPFFWGLLYASICKHHHHIVFFISANTNFLQHTVSMRIFYSHTHKNCHMVQLCLLLLRSCHCHCRNSIKDSTFFRADCFKSVPHTRETLDGFQKAILYIYCKPRKKPYYTKLHAGAVLTRQESQHLKPL